MPCKCDPSWKGGKCRCNDSPPLPAGSPQRALNFKICPQGAECGGRESRSVAQNKHVEGTATTKMSRTTRGDDSFKRVKINIPENCQETNDEGQEIMELDTNCVSLEYRRRAPCAKPLSPRVKKPRCPAQGPEVPSRPPPCSQEAVGKKRRKLLVRGRRKDSDRSVECSEGNYVRIPCGVSIADYKKDLECHENEKYGALEQNISTTRCNEDCGYSTSGTQIFQTDTHGKPCSSDKRRNMLKSKLRELFRDIEPIPESCLLESTESKPEPEVLAEVLLMSEAEGIDLGEIKPDNVFNNLFADMSFDQAIAITSAAPESMSDVVVPVQMTGQESTSVEMPNSERIIESIRGEAPPNLNAFQQSDVYEQFSDHMNKLLERTPDTQNIPGLLGASGLKDSMEKTQRTEDGILDYVMKPGPPTHVNRIHLNGSVRPIWFPGYTVLSPFIPGYTRMTNDPGEALKEAWRLCRPQHFNDESISLVNMG